MKTLEALKRSNQSQGVTRIEHLSGEQNNGVDSDVVLVEGDVITLPSPLEYGNVPIRGGGSYEAILGVKVTNNGAERYINLSSKFMEKPIFPAKIDSETKLVIRTTDQPLHHSGAAYDAYRTAEGDVNSIEKGWEAVAAACPNGFRVGQVTKYEATVYDRKLNASSTTRTKSAPQYRLDAVA